ncbi:hypothetical protein HHI36_000788 [Cryptolaemus montrouzieri]|uniref:Endonuclease/exonuclease/phosphatase domain-containing protein n=1 Tax=Cryptolaemus montrouzieri TaxID=559131 RepID=A0ABD2P5I4_9CUCU
MLASVNLRQIVTAMTRTRVNQEFSRLDLILTSDVNILTSPAHLSPIGKSDHVTLTCDLQLGLDKQRARKKTRLKTDSQRVNELLGAKSWQSLFANISVRECWSLFLEQVHEIVNSCSLEINFKQVLVRRYDMAANPI